MTPSYAHLIGQDAQIQLGELWFRVTITDVKQTYGRLRFLVKPVAGDGQAWVNADRVLYAKQDRSGS